MLTAEQTKEIQIKLGIEADGAFGDKTKAAVYEALVGLSSVNIPSVAITPTPLHWPLQSECDRFYGNPRGPDGNLSPVWYSANIVKITPPFKIMMGNIPITRISIHRKCAESAQRILNVTWDKIGRDQAKADALEISKFSGSYNYRVIRGEDRLSMHAYGAAWDFDAEHNALGQHNHFYTSDHPLVVAHREEGWTWGAGWRRPDAMHFQAARVN